MEKADVERSRDARKFGCILLSRVIENTGRPGTRKAFAALALTTTAMLVLAAALVSPPAILGHDDHEFTTFTVDVAQDPSTNAQNDVDPAEGQILFTRGDTYIVDGKIYSAGTIPSGIADPDPNSRVIGKYRIRGTFTTDAADFNRAIAGDPSASRIVAFATESFSLPDDETTILTDGVWPNARLSAHRVVLGGTGRFRDVVGEIFEQNIGEGTLGFCNSRVTFRLKKSTARHDH
jgi:hypothetical protein